MGRPTHLCLGGCGRLIAGASRCRRCQREVNRARRDPALDSAAWQSERHELITAWVASRGYVCPGYRREAHRADPRSNPLTADHEVARVRSRLTGEVGRLGVLCRECNGRKRDNRPLPSATVP